MFDPTTLLTSATLLTLFGADGTTTITVIQLLGLPFEVFEWALENEYGGRMDRLAEFLGVRMLGYRYMQRAYLAAVCIAVIGPLVGTFLVHREIALLGDTLAHTAFAGVAVGLFLDATLSISPSPLLTAFATTIVAAVLVELLVERAGVYSDTSLAMVLTGGFALGSVLITATDGGIAVGIDAYLFGSLATVSTSDVAILVGMTVLVGGLVTLAYRPLLYVTFDVTAARSARLNVRLYRYLLVILTALVVVSAMQIMGVILVAAMLVVPVAAASAVASSFKRSILLAILVAEVAAISGVTAAYVYGIAAGGSIVLAAISAYGAVLVGQRLL